MIDRLMTAASALIVATISAMGYGGIALLMAIESAACRCPRKSRCRLRAIWCRPAASISTWGDRRRGGMPAWVVRRLFHRCGRRAPAAVEIRALHFDRAARSRTRGSLFRPLGLARGVHQPPPAGRAHVSSRCLREWRVCALSRLRSIRYSAHTSGVSAWRGPK